VVAPERFFGTNRQNGQNPRIEGTMGQPIAMIKVGQDIFFLKRLAGVRL
jgi:hypothetical protein